MAGGHSREDERPYRQAGAPDEGGAQTPGRHVPEGGDQVAHLHQGRPSWHRLPVPLRQRRLLGCFPRLEGDLRYGGGTPRGGAGGVVLGLGVGL